MSRVTRRIALRPQVGQRLAGPGYRVIAETVYAALLDQKLIP